MAAGDLDLEEEENSEGDNEIEEHRQEQGKQPDPSGEQSENTQIGGTISQDTGHIDDQNTVDTTEISSGLNVKSYKYQGLHPIDNVLTDLTSGITTRSGLKNLCAFQAFVSMVEPKKVNEALLDEDWIQAMQEELNQFKRSKAWHFVPSLEGRTMIGTKWVYRNKLDENGTVIRNKARLVVQGINYDETFASVARLEAIRLLIAFVIFKEFTCESAFLNGYLKEEIYVKQPPGFENPEFPDHVYKLDKALYGLKQAPRACVASPSTIILMSEDGIAYVVSLNGPPSSPTIAENHSSDLSLVLLLEASSEGESREHATFRVALDGSTNWSSVSRNHFFPSSTELFLMALSVTPIPLSIDTSVEIPLANLVPTKASKRTRAFVRTFPTSPDIVISDDDVVFCRVRRGKHIASKSYYFKPKPTPKSHEILFKICPNSLIIKKFHVDIQKETGCFPCFLIVFFVWIGC
ncbi:hypothetical protein MTR67_003324 [Solanum verrucosum]|uniref:Reverse transcriptase Ty1/copia-type domain-containing protein n=1 Tax=Solanum verrucosum TaxID=315347 RepID=A0AAF0T9K7_SOLVR|nr:hypothetical protein MTR67_003324 [Solanum verrucosum]